MLERSFCPARQEVAAQSASTHQRLTSLGVRGPVRDSIELVARGRTGRAVPTILRDCRSPPDRPRPTAPTDHPTDHPRLTARAAEAGNGNPATRQPGIRRQSPFEVRAAPTAVSLSSHPLPMP